MKMEISSLPETMAGIQRYGFSWVDFVTAIPSPIFVATNYKANGKPNACLQSWTTFVGDDDGFYAILGAVNKHKHLYQCIQESGVVVLNFPSADIYDKCTATIRNNGYEDDELALSGLTAEPAQTVNAPRIRECFLSLECECLWEKERHAGDHFVVMCVHVKHVAMDSAHMDETDIGRYAESGYIYNIHNPVNPLSGQEEGDSLGMLRKIKRER